jgi:hypothetical protein
VQYSSSQHCAVLLVESLSAGPGLEQYLIVSFISPVEEGCSYREYIHTYIHTRTDTII